MQLEPEHTLVETGTVQAHHHGAGTSGDYGPDLEQPKPERLALRSGRVRPPQGGSAHRFEQGVGQDGQQHPVLASPALRARGAVGKQSELLPLHPILHVAARAVHPLMELVRLTLEVGHDEARDSPLETVLDADDDPPGAVPTTHGVLETRGTTDSCVQSPENRPWRPRTPPEPRVPEPHFRPTQRCTVRCYDRTNRTSGAGRTPSRPEAQYEPSAWFGATDSPATTKSHRHASTH